MKKTKETPTTVTVLSQDEVKVLLKDAREYLSDGAVDDVEIKNQEDFDFWTEVLAEVKTLNKKLEEQKKSATDPLTQVISTIRSWFKPTQDELERAEKTIKAKLGVYILSVESEKKRLLAEAAKASKAGESRASSEALAKLGSTKVESQTGTSYRFTIDIEIVDLELLPDEWWTPDEQAITRFVRATHGEKPIPGVVFHKRPIISQATK